LVVSDFRSDTVTQPTDGMRRAMAQAEVGDDVLDGDPTVRALEQRAAEWAGREAALFVPSGTMANQLAIGTWTRPGEVMLAEASAHVLLYEAGAAGALHGLQTLPVRGTGGVMALSEVERVWQETDLHTPGVSLVCVEQTHMSSGGRVQPLAELERLYAWAHGRGARVHMDGARLANAVVASGIDARDWAAQADSVSVCLSKGLGAPVGSLLIADGDAIERALRLRKRLGGGMRQAGFLAAAGLVALEEGLPRLAEDHALARSLAERLSALDGVHCDPESVETNIVTVELVHPERDPQAVASELEAAGVRALLFPPNILRFVTHRDVGPSDAERCAAAMARILTN